MKSPLHSSRFIAPRVLLLLLVLLVACSGSPIKPDATVEAVVAQPGAEAWEGSALDLPADSPWVVRLDAKSLLVGAKSLRAWLIAEPEMFGEAGPQVMRELDVYWGVMAGYLGADISAPETWSKQGLDITRPVYIGGYAPTAASIQSADTIEQRLADELGVERPQLLGKLASIDRDKEVPSGLHGRLMADLQGLRSVSGMRMLIPASAPSDLLVFVDALAMNAGYTQFSAAEISGLDLGQHGLAYFHEKGELPTLAARKEADTVVLDFIFPASLGHTLSGEDLIALRPQQLKDIRWGVHQVQSGRPAAPANPDTSSISVSIDQTGAWNVARIRQYSEALQKAKAARASQRDGALVQEMFLANLSAYAWALRAKDAPGVAYSLRVFPPEAKETFVMDVSIFASHATPNLNVSKGKRGLNVPERALGFSGETASLRDDVWFKWFQLADSYTQFDFVDAGEAGMFGIFSLPRNLIMIMGEVVRAGPDSFDPMLGKVVGVLPNADRVEVVALDPDLRDFARKPRILAHVAFRPELSASERDQVLAETRDAVLLYRQDLLSLKPPEKPAPPASQGAWATADSADPAVRYRWDDQGAMFTVGLTEEEANIEWDKSISDESGTPELAYFRLNAVSMMTLIPEKDLKSIKPFDAAILGQRLGTLEASLTPMKTGDSQYLRFRFTLLDPLNL